MNHRMILFILSRVLLAEAVLLAGSACVGLLYGESVLLTFGVPVALLLACAAVMWCFKPRSHDFYARDGMVAVSLAWILMSAFGALPFWLSGYMPSYVDCFFETVSGFTTTGASVLPAVEHLPRGLLFWRSFTHWIGGMGVLVFLMAIIPLAGDRSMHLMRAESPGPSVGKLVPRARTSALILYGMYCALTIAQIIFLLAGGMPLFDSVVHTFGTAGTGGFSIKNTSIMAYNSPYVEIVITVFMLLFGVNFSLYYLVLVRRPLEALKSEELQWYLGFFAAVTLLIAFSIRDMYDSFATALRHAAFQTSSIITTTGYATTDFNLWPEFSHALIILVMIVGACAGSTGGGFKVSRVVILVKSIRREVYRMLHPRAVAHIKFEGKSLDTEIVHGVLVYLGLYVIIAMVSVLLVALDGYDHTTTVTAVLSALNNVGPGLGEVGPMGNYGLFSAVSKLVLSADMLIGRLEIIPLIVLCTPSVWRRR